VVTPGVGYREGVAHFSLVGEREEGSTVRGVWYRPDRAPEATFRVAVIEGPDQGTDLILTGNEASAALVGHSGACALRLTDRQVSRRHLALAVDGARVRLTDLQSTNGTRVNGVALLDGYLVGGETVALGATILRIERRAEAPAPVPSGDRSFGRLLGASLEMRRLYPLARRLAGSLVPVVIEGETGTGKEVLAEALHEQGPRAAGPYVVFDCTTIAPNLIEAELFGHERGAFTGAVATRKGVFEQAHGGTLFLDEIGDLDISLQAKLLRAIERSEVRRVGGDKTHRVDVRILAATRRDLDHEVQEGRFRDDLFHRLAVARLELPPLRSRGGDVALLALHFWEELGGQRQDLPQQLLQRWEDSPWPGNVRELRNTIARQLALGDLALTASEPPRSELPETSSASTEGLETERLPSGAGVFAEVLAERLPLTLARVKVVDAFERLYLAQVLAEHGGNVAKAAASSGIARRYFQLLRSRHRG
jgi:two-component system, NtrC family, response regulator HydG